MRLLGDWSAGTWRHRRRHLASAGRKQDAADPLIASSPRRASVIIRPRSQRSGCRPADGDADQRCLCGDGTARPADLADAFDEIAHAFDGATSFLADAERTSADWWPSDERASANSVVPARISTCNSPNFSQFARTSSGSRARWRSMLEALTASIATRPRGRSRRRCACCGCGRRRVARGASSQQQLAGAMQGTREAMERQQEQAIEALEAARAAFMPRRRNPTPVDGLGPLRWRSGAATTADQRGGEPASPTPIA